MDKRYIEPCKHPVHADCFLMTKKKTCPMCRQIVTWPRFPKEDYKLVQKIQVAVIVSVLWIYILVTIWFYFTNLKDVDSG